MCIQLLSRQKPSQLFFLSRSDKSKYTEVDIRDHMNQCFKTREQFPCDDLIHEQRAVKEQSKAVLSTGHERLCAPALHRKDLFLPHV